MEIESGASLIKYLFDIKTYAVLTAITMVILKQIDTWYGQSL